MVPAPAGATGRGFKWPGGQVTRMYRAILPNGDIACASYERQDEGVEVYTEAGETLAFIPYTNLVAVVDEDVSAGEDRATM